MARYDYKCSSCGNVFEVEHPMSETPEVVCPSCGAPAAKTFSASGIKFEAAVSTTPTSEAAAPAPAPRAAAAPTARTATRNNAAPRSTPIAGLFLCSMGS